MKLDLLTSLYVFMLAGFIGFEVIRRASPLLHTPLMSLTNALDAIAVVGAIILAGEHKTNFSTVLGTMPSSPPPATSSTVSSLPTACSRCLK
jgi:NAD(P) transhydrogenase subunit alpha